MAYFSYYIFEHPDAWTHQDTRFKRIVGYYTAPYIMVLSIVFPLYQWFKCRKIEVRLNERVIYWNGNVIDISKVNEIHKIYIPLTKSFQYIFYEVVPMEHRKKAVIPIFFIPNSEREFERELNEFCIKNHVELVLSKNIKM
ncbi:hypothetical protein GCM10017161_10050 [Thalassotalea marina]|uniref:Uncharacterized protein n=2 Tax=Thalassotalea marina TaxID=1673741 RepID=A0A919BE62_9GAMM|nr:hypothetical protein GCM10017161_10050 [Thalassotalea marina]